MRRLNGSEVLLECLKEQNVTDIFGFPGGAVLNIYDALYKQTDIKHYLTSHEQGAAHAADGYARATGRVGVCLATSGPGATNLVTGIATAYMDSAPMVAVTGNVATPLLGKDSFQEVDIAGITMPITKHGFIVRDASEIADVMRRAFHIAASGRPGPVLVDITKDATAGLCDYVYESPAKIEAKTDKLTNEALERAAELLEKSQRPVIMAGGGVISSGADAELLAFAEKTGAPVCVTAMGIGAFPASHPQLTGMIGMHGTQVSNMAVTECDLLIAVGARFSDRVISDVTKFAPNAKILHIDVDPAEINKNIVVTEHVTGDAKIVLSRLVDKLSVKDRKEWRDKVFVKKTNPFSPNGAGALRPHYVLDRVDAFLGGDGIVVTEVGQHQMWAAHRIKREYPRTFLTSGGLGTMGFGLGAAIGAKVGRTDKTVVNIAGDGCFRMNCIELATAVNYGVPIIEVILNNHALGMVRQWQTMFYDKRYSQTTLAQSPDFAKLAEVYGAVGLTVTKPAEMDEALETARKSGRPAVINCEIGEDEKVFPMVPSGKGLADVIVEGD